MVQLGMSSLDARDRRSLVVIVREALEQAIHDGTYAAGTQLPAEEDLAETLGVSRATLRDVLRSMENDGFVHRRRGLGTFVLKRATLQNTLEVNCGVTDLIRSAGMEPGCEHVELRRVTVDPYVASKLGVAAGSTQCRMDRVRTADKVPIVISVDYFHPDVVLDDASLAAGESLYGALKAAGRVVHHGVAEIEASAADSKLARQLQLAPKSPLLVLRQVDYDADDRPVLFSIEWHAPHVFQTIIYRRGPQFV